MDRFGLELVGSHLRISRSASDNGWLVVLYDGRSSCSPQSMISIS